MDAYMVASNGVCVVVLNNCTIVCQLGGWPSWSVGILTDKLTELSICSVTKHRLCAVEIIFYHDNNMFLDKMFTILTQGGEKWRVIESPR